MWGSPSVLPITGIMAAGKSTVAEQTPDQMVTEILARTWTAGRIG